LIFSGICFEWEVASLSSVHHPLSIAESFILLNTLLKEADFFFKKVVFYH